MSYLASIYVCLLALFGALLLWALSAVVTAAAESLRARFVQRRDHGPLRISQAPKAPRMLRTGEASIH